MLCVVTTALVGACTRAVAPATDAPETGYYTVVATGVSAGIRRIAGFTAQRDFAGSDGVTPFRVVAGVERTLTGLRAGAQGTLVAMNESGEVVGHDQHDGEPFPVVLRWPAGTDSPVTIPFEARGAIDINDAGDVLLIPGVWSEEEKRDTAFVLWTSQGREVVSSRSVETWPSLILTAKAMNDSRTILTDVYSLGSNGPVLVHPGAPAESAICPFPVGPPPDQVPVALNDSGAYVIRRWWDDCLVQPGHAPRILPAFRTHDRGLNNNGWMIGEILHADSARSPRLPAVSVRGGDPVTVGRLFATTADAGGWTVERFVGINDENAILAVGSQGQRREFVILVPRH